MTIPKMTITPSPLGLKQNANRVEVMNGGKSASVQDTKDQAKMKKACQDFEAIFLNYLMSKMRESVPKSDVMGSSQGEEIYRGMLDEELTKQMAMSGGIGLGKVLYQQLSASLKSKE